MSITLIIIIATVAASFYAWNDANIMYKWMLEPYTMKRKNEYQRFITSGFIHADYLHLGLNMFSLFSFGEVAESIFEQVLGPNGKYAFLAFYLIALVASDLPVFFKHKDNYNYRALGASGAVSSVIFLVILFFPTSEVRLYFVPMPAFIMGVLYIGYSYWMSKNQYDNISHEAHLYGALFGLATGILIYPAVLLRFVEQISELTR